MINFNLIEKLLTRLFCSDQSLILKIFVLQTSMEKIKKNINSNSFYRMKIDYFLRFNRSTTRKPFRTTRDAFRHRVNIFESMNIVPRAAFAIVLFYFPDAGRTI